MIRNAWYRGTISKTNTKNTKVFYMPRLTEHDIDSNILTLRKYESLDI